MKTTEDNNTPFITYVYFSMIHPEKRIAFMITREDREKIENWISENNVERWRTHDGFDIFYVNGEPVLCWDEETRETWKVGEKFFEETFKEFRSYFNEDGTEIDE